MVTIALSTVESYRVETSLNPIRVVKLTKIKTPNAIGKSAVDFDNPMEDVLLTLTWVSKD